jgi:hypothetical protein
VPLKIRQLIREMSLANPLWGAPRIHGELLKLGIDIGQTSVAKYMARRRRPPSQGWRTFLLNHADGIAAMDLFVVPTISFRLLYGLLILRHDRRRILWLGATTHRLPSARPGNGEHGFQPGHDKPGPGRPKGSPDRIGREIKIALLDAGEHVGEQYAAEDAAAREAQGLPPDPTAPRGLAAYLARLSKTHPTPYAALLAKVLPTQISAEHSVQEQREYRSYEEIANRLKVSCPRLAPQPRVARSVRNRVRVRMCPGGPCSVPWRAIRSVSAAIPFGKAINKDRLTLLTNKH